VVATQPLHAGGNCVRQGVWVGRGRRLGLGVENGAVLIDDSGGDLGPSDVDADSQSHANASVVVCSVDVLRLRGLIMRERYR
jgi:hypothetical protein